MAEEDRRGEEGSEGRQGDPPGSPVGLLDQANPSAGGGKSLKSPLFAAEHAERYQRQELIREYEAAFSCRLVVMRAPVFPDSITYVEELLFDADPSEDLHMILDSPGGDGETAVRLARSAQARCREFTVIVPDQAKSAATILAMGAHQILMGPTSDLGPVDPQFPVGDPPNRTLVAAKDIIAAVEAAERAIASNPDTFPLHASLLSDVSALMVQQARSAIDRSGDLVMEALKSCKGRTDAEVDMMLANLRRPLIDDPKNHAAVFGVHDAKACGLPVTEMDPQSDQWQRVWRLFAKYFVVNGPIYEGRFASRIFVD
ncbi:MAG TPA: hypothetical protein VFU19_14895 [Iamia sp.]|nr:hypothetical protein [Iamia sp.]